MIAHTPGPWKWWTSNSYRRLTADGGQDGGVLSGTVQNDGHEDIRCSDADMALIAAAPELLAALREIADGCISRRPGHFDYHLIRTKAEVESVARAAIAKATS